MGQRVRRPRQGGGITRLATNVLEHREAVEYDLLTKTGHSIDDIGRSLSWDALGSFFTHLGPDSALVCKFHPELSTWASTPRTNLILADIWNMLAHINANIVAIGSGRPAKKVKPYPTPWNKPPEEEQHFGKGALPPDELREWFDAKRAKKCQK